MHLVTLRAHRFLKAFGMARSALVFAGLAGMLGLSVAATQLATPQTAQAASWLHYQRGYYLDNGWFCYGWSSGAYHCTHHWHRSGGRVISDNPAWVPNNLTGATITSTSWTRSVHRSATRPAPVTHSTYIPSGSANPGTAAIISEINSVFGSYGWQAVNVARCESGFNPNAYNSSSGASGIFQFLASTWSTTSYAGYSRFNASANIHAAYQVFSRDGYSWREWSCKP